MRSTTVRVPEALLEQALQGYRQALDAQEAGPAALLGAMLDFRRSAEALGVALVQTLAEERAAWQTRVESVPVEPAAPVEPTDTPTAPSPPEAPQPASPPLERLQLESLIGGMGPNWSQPDALPTPTGAPLPHTALPEQRPRSLAEGLAALQHALNLLDPQDERSDAVLRTSGQAVASFARAIQDDLEGDEQQQEALARCFQALTRWSKLRRPGILHGLARDHTPRPHGSWWSHYLAHHPDGATPSADQAFSRLQSAVDRGLRPTAVREAALKVLDAGGSVSDPRWKILTDREKLFQSTPRLQPVQKELARARLARAPAPKTAVQTGDELAGRRVVAVGNMARPGLQEAIAQAFGAEVHWSTNEPRRVDAVAQQVRAGTVDLLVVYVDFLDHKTTGVLHAAAKARQVPQARPKGGGTQATLDAIRQVLPQLSP